MIRWLKTLMNNLSNHHVRYDCPFFLESSIQREIAKNGYAVRPLLNESDLKSLNENFEKLLNMLGEPLPETHWSSGRIGDVEIRNFARNAINNILPMRLTRFFDKKTTDFVGGIYVAKKPSATSKLTAHQDSSHTDETMYPAVYAWIPLVDTTVKNGAMHVIPGSHLWGNRYRSLNIPWLFSGLEEQLQPYLKAIPMKAGEVLFFDSATIHFSSDNLSHAIRPAVNYFIKPKCAMFLHHYIDEKTPLNKVEVFNVDIDFFYNFDFEKRPPCPPYTFLRYEEYDTKALRSLASIFK